jgi:hypothetical protein
MTQVELKNTDRNVGANKGSEKLLTKTKTLRLEQRLINEGQACRKIAHEGRSSFQSVCDWFDRITFPRLVPVKITIKYLLKIRPPGVELCHAT